MTDIYFYGFPSITILLILYLIFKNFVTGSFIKNIEIILSENLARIEKVNSVTFENVTKEYNEELAMYLNKYDQDIKSKFSNIENSISEFENNILKLENQNNELTEKLEKQHSQITKYARILLEKNAVIERKSKQIKRLKDGV